MSAVADADPLIALATIGHFDLLRVAWQDITIPNFLILEYALSPTRDACQAASEAECFRAREGRIALPSKPGLGVELDQDYLQRHPYQGVKLWPGLRCADGGLADV